MYHILTGGDIMKKILFIMILATILFIPISQTGASLGEMNVSHNQKEQTMKNQTSKGIDVLDSEKLLESKRLKRKAKIRKIHQNRARLTSKKISIERRDRLVGLLLLAHGSQR